ncbi:MAG: TonB-dependent receptor [Gammaproteobacteria bacterium]
MSKPTNFNSGRTAVAPLAMLAAIGAGAVGTPAAAQSGARVSAIEEVVVTAQRREEKLQELPVAISALDAAQLEAQGVASVGSLRNGAVPVVRVTPNAGSRSEFAIGMRGVFTGDPSQATVEFGVAAYIDDVYMARGQGIGMELMELERVEVLRGPQGTLFGRNAMGGAIRLVSKKPTGEFGLEQSVSYGEFDHVKSVTRVNLPEFAGVKIKLEGLYDAGGAWVENADPAQNDPGEFDSHAYRVAVRWEPNEKFTVDYSYDYSFSQDTGAYAQLTRYTTNADRFTNLSAAGIANQALQRTVLPAVTGREDRTIFPANRPFAETENFGHIITAVWQINDAVSLKSVTGIRGVNYDPGSSKTDGVGAWVGIGGGNFLTGTISEVKVEQDQFSQELLLLGRTDRVDWTIGAFYWDETAIDERRTSFGTLVNANTGIARTSDPAFRFPFASFSHHDLKLTHYALFGQATWTPPVLDDRLALTFGFRHSTDDKEGVRVRAENVAAPLSPPLKGALTTHHLDPMVTLKYQWTESFSTYFRYSTSYRTGGNNIRSSSFRPYDEEKLTSYELGMKSEWFDNRLRLNIAGFLTDWENQQLSFQTLFTSVTETVNIDEVLQSKGVEVDFTVVPLEGLTISGSYNWLEATNPQIANPFTGLPETVNRPYQPEHSGNVAIDYEWAGTPWGVPRAHLDWTWNTEQFFVVRSDAADDRSVVNLRLSLSQIPLPVFGGDRGHLEVQAFVNNLFDEEYSLFGFTSPTFGLQGAFFEDPRTVGFTVKYVY